MTLLDSSYGRRRADVISCLLAALCSLGTGAHAKEPSEITTKSHVAQSQIATPATVTPAGPLSLADLENLATQYNPTLAQAEATIRAARGRATQAGLMPNPVVGFQGEEFAFRQLGKKPEYFGFVEQNIPLGGKLRKSRQIVLREVAQAEIEALAQKQRIINSIRGLYYEVLGAQQTVRLEADLWKIAQTATNTTSELFNVGQADKPDFLESQIEQEQVAHDLQVAQNNYDQTWRALAAVLGKPDMMATLLQGNLEERLSVSDEKQIYARLIQESPQIKSAQAQIERARAVLVRAKAEPIPDLFVRGAIGYSTELLETASDAPLRPTGVEANAQVGFTLPIWNRYQGGIAAARAELAFAEREYERLKLVLRVQLAQTMRDYKNALDAVTRYRTVMIPRADEAYKLYLSKFQQMGASYPQVIIAQRTMFQVRHQYINSLVDLQHNATQLEGFLLSGGLEAPSVQPSTTVQRIEMTGVRAGSEGAPAHISPLENAGLIEY